MADANPLYVLIESEDLVYMLEYLNNTQKRTDTGWEQWPRSGLGTLSGA